MEWRESIMAAGATACYDMFTEVSELAEILAALGRYAGLTMRMEARTTTTIEVATSVSWQLMVNGRMLRSPYGRTLFLTRLECRLLRYAAVSDRHLLRRKSERPMDDVWRSTPELPHLDRLVSRLRRKAQNVGINLPLVAVRCGYFFAERLDMAAIEAPS
jgi:DNA-binding response OmpR family regulator